MSRVYASSVETHRRILNQYSMLDLSESVPKDYWTSVTMPFIVAEAPLRMSGHIKSSHVAGEHFFQTKGVPPLCVQQAVAFRVPVCANDLLGGCLYHSDTVSVVIQQHG